MDLHTSWHYIETIAKIRLKNNITPRHVSEYGDSIEIMGAAGELAALRELGLDETLHTRFDEGVDFLWRGWTVDVKSTKLTPRLNFRYLQWPHFKPIVADIIIMTAVEIHEHQAIVCGFTTRAEMRKAPLNNSRRVPCREIPIINLIPCWELTLIREKNFALRQNEYGLSHRRLLTT